MNSLHFSNSERDKVKEYFGKLPEELLDHEFEQRLRELRATWHPDKFEKFGDETVRLLATDKYKEIELLADKIRTHLKSKKDPISTSVPVNNANEKYAYNRLKIEIITREKDLKYYLFGTHYRWLERGDSYRIKGTDASIVIDANYANRSIGFTESIKMYLTFTENDSLEIIMMWLFSKILGYATQVLIEGKAVQVDYPDLMAAVKAKTLLRLNG
ncbi:MAG: hypothetical protein IH598_00670 [Bacteroidales bacterium]|nr:hypothetical protein [Bacteroidales bacterium]